MPEDNEKDYMEEVPKEIREKLKTHFVKNAGQVLRIALDKNGKPGG